MGSKSYSKGICWIDDCRIGTETRTNSKKDQSIDGEWGMKSLTSDIKNYGRFPANILVSDDMLNDGVITKSSDNEWIGGLEKNWKGHTNKRIHSYSDKGSNSRYYDIDKWFDKILND